MTSRSLLSALAVCACCAAASKSEAQFSVASTGESLTVAEIETALDNAGVTVSSTALDGVALGPGNTVFIIHNDSGALTVAHIDLTSKAANWVKTEAQILTDLSLSGNLTLVGEFVYDSTNDRLVLASDINAVAPGDPWTVFEIDASASPYTAATLVSSPGIQGWNSHDVTSTGVIVGALGEEFEVLTGGEPKTVFIDETTTPGSPAAVDLFDVDDFKAATAAGAGDEITGELPPETVGIDPSDDTIYIFGHDNFELLAIEGLSATDPIDPEVLGWDDALTPGGSRVDLHGLEVDGNGTVYGFDEAAAQIVLWDGADVPTDVTGAIAFADIATDLGNALGAAEPVLWRGMKARALTATQSELFIATAASDFGLIRVVIDAGGASVGNWERY
ncbi:MAG: hypothetical protein RLY93_04060 [Sumerlaeia bacterium]